MGVWRRQFKSTYSGTITLDSAPLKGSLIVAAYGWSSGNPVGDPTINGMSMRRAFVQHGPYAAQGGVWYWQNSSFASAPSVVMTQSDIGGCVVEYVGADRRSPIRSVSGRAGLAGEARTDWYAPPLLAEPGDVVFGFYGNENNVTSLSAGSTYSLIAHQAGHIDAEVDALARNRGQYRPHFVLGGTWYALVVIGIVVRPTMPLPHVASFYVAPSGGGFSTALFRDNAGQGAVGCGPFARSNAGVGVLA